MPTAVGTEATPVRLLSNLLQLDYDAIAAYELALSYLESPQLRGPVARFRDDHARHTERLGGLLQALGEPVPSGPDSQQLLTTGQVLLAAPWGERALLRAMNLNEDDTETAYRRAAAHKGLAAEIHQALEQAHADECRHSAWFAGQLAGLSRRAASG